MGKDRRAVTHDATYDLVDNTLHLRGGFGLEQGSCVRAALRDLLATGCPDLIVDLSGAAHFSGALVRFVFIALASAHSEARRVTVRAGQKVHVLLRAS